MFFLKVFLIMFMKKKNWENKQYLEKNKKAIILVKNIRNV